MRRVVLYGLGWLAAATVAVMVAWLGVGRVGSSVTDRHASPLTADEARTALTARPPDSGGPPGGAPDTSPGGSTGSTAPTGRATTTTTARRPGGAPATTSTTARAPVGTPTTTATTTPAAPATTTTTAGIVRTYNLVGGSATLRFEPGKVSVVWADPNPGFRVEVDNRSDGGVRIRFDGDSHRSELEAWWDGGPRDSVDEQGGGGSGSG